MAKDKKEKKKPDKKPKRTNSSASSQLKTRSDDGIAKSKQLSAKQKTPKSFGKTRSSRSSSSSKNTRPKFCCNGKPMPSLAELEKMFEDSDEDDAPATSTPVISVAKPIPTQKRCRTPVDKPVIIDVEKLTSPTTIKELSNKVMEYISNLADPTIILDEGPPPPVIPPKKRKKPEEPYIVGCTERPAVCGVSNAVVGHGGSKYGFDKNDIGDEEEDSSAKRFRSQIAAPTKSIFNKYSDDIANMLKANEIAETLSNGSNDSNKTLPYDFSASSPSTKIRAFSPIPSTSTDNETFLKNDLRLNESLKEILKDSSQSHIEVNESLKEIIKDSPQSDIEVNESLKESLINESSHSDVELIELPCETIIINEDASESKDFWTKNKIVEPEVVEVKPQPASIDLDDYPEEDNMYSSIIDLDEICDSDVCEVIDVDNLIAENEAIINKYKKPAISNTVTVVSNDAIPKVEHSNDDVCVVEDTPKKQNDIESVVKSYFKRHSMNNDDSSVVNISDSTANSTFASNTSANNYPSFVDSMYDTLINFTQSFANAFSLRRSMSHVAARTPSSSSNLDILDLDQTTGNPSLTVPSINVPAPPIQGGLLTSTSTYSAPPINSTTLGDRPINNSVILASNLPVNRTPTRTKAKKGKKNKTVTPIVPPSPLKDNEQPVARSIGDCPICMENLSNRSVASTICGHVFCMKCIQAAIKASGKKCPTCRKALRGPGGGYHQLFL